MLDSVTPLKEIRIKQRSEPWMTQDIILNIRESDKLLKNFKTNNDTDYYESYCKLRNRLEIKFKETLNLLNNNTFSIKLKITRTILKSAGKA